MRVLAIDGPGGSGKSTVARRVAATLQLPVLDTGAMYRAVTVLALERGVALDDPEALVATARSAQIEVGERVTLNERDVTEAIRTPIVDAAVSTVARVAGVRTILISQQRAWGERHDGAVAEGRDMGAVVFPDALLKVYLTASEEERARRRHGDRAAADSRDAAAEQHALSARDARDVPSTLVPAEGAWVIDSTSMTVDEVVDAIVARWQSLEAHA